MEYNQNNIQEDSVKKKWIKRIWGALPAVFLLFLLLVIALLFVQIGAEKEAIKADKLAKMKTDRPPINVVALDLVPMPIRDRLSLPGVIEPWVKLEILAEVRGKITKKAVKEGARIKKGELIASIDIRDHANSFKSAKASYDVALADYERIKKLYDEQLATKSQMDNALAQAENYKAGMDNAA
ncbi:MAG: biotin/lipoyl-binding protein, partial [Deltaproteobacteria bacterium]|nr:biotin/lipoyl-binding protein [Deltaproteobacteria bacterium]MBT8373284.1 biotin/lipoyl-binding protein [Deltaproteobacteria bacterium]